LACINSRTTRTRRLRASARVAASDGFTVFEVLIAAVVLVVGLLSLSALLDNSVKASASTNERESATNLARQIIEDAHSLPYAQISPKSIVPGLQALGGLGNETPGPTWHIVRRGVSYTVTVTECAIDDPKDGLGKHVNGFGENWFCEGEKESTGKEVNEDSTPEDLKRVTVDVKWSAIGRTPDVHQVALLSSAGAAPGLAAGELHLETPGIPGPGVAGTPTQPSITEEPASETLTFAASAPPSTKAMRWSLEGITQTPDPTLKSGTTWTFSWPIPIKSVSDGTYQVSVQAIDATGVAGPPVSIPVRLIRSVPAALAGLKGGFNEVFVSGAKQPVAELEWQANTERNVIGYAVYNPSGQLVCPESEATLSTALSCTDFHAPLPTSANLTYSAVALYRNASGAVTKGPAANLTLVGGPPPAPNAPGKLEAQKNAEGAVVLTWQPPPSGGEPVVFYRIYRGSTEYTSRYGVSATTSFTDPDAATAHSYWVTAVDANLTESAPEGPANG
jgi:hypothetical protein